MKPLLILPEFILSNYLSECSKVNRIFMLLFILFTPSAFLFSQRTVQPTATCLNHNAFLYDDRLDSIEPFIHRVMWSGGILLDPEKDSLSRIFEEMQLDSGTTFELTLEENSLGDSILFYQRHQQLYNGVEVYGGGYTLGYINAGGPKCPLIPYVLTPYLKFNIGIGTEPAVSVLTLATILDADTLYSTKLIIGHNMDTLCEYTLFYLVEYFDGENRISWVNANTGDVFLTSELEVFISINAPTQDYNTVTINNAQKSGVTYLQKDDESIKVFDFNQIENVTGEYLSYSENWDEDLIPTTTASSWTTEADPGAFQAFYSAEISQNRYLSTGINLGQVHVGYCDCVTGAFNSHLTTEEDFYIVLGQISSVSVSQVDVVAHELAHSYLRGRHILSRDTDYGKSVHEGMADIFGTYMEYLEFSSVDWVMGGDNVTVAGEVNRDLENPNTDYDCYTEIATTTLEHQGGVPLGYWFYLISEGGTNIPALGIDESFSIVKDALQNIPYDSDYHDIMVATLNVVEVRYGFCSDQFDAVANAWETICVSTGLPMTSGVVNSCDISLLYQPGVCEEDNYANICVSGAVCNTPLN